MVTDVLEERGTYTLGEKQSKKSIRELLVPGV
jgi:hypothetical protein